MEYGHCARCGGKKLFKSVAGTLYFLVVQNPRSVLSEVERNKILFAMADGKYVKPEETRVTTSKTKAEQRMLFQGLTNCDPNCSTRQQHSVKFDVRIGSV